jgi:hypothetical protein
MVVLIVYLTALSLIPWHVEPLLGSELEANDETISAARKQIRNKQIYKSVAE